MFLSSEEVRMQDWDSDRLLDFYSILTIKSYDGLKSARETFQA